MHEATRVHAGLPLVQVLKALVSFVAQMHACVIGRDCSFTICSSNHFSGLPCDPGADASIHDVDRITPYAHAIYRGLKDIAAKIKVSKPSRRNSQQARFASSKEARDSSNRISAC